jgi:hypothetical protein
MRKTIRKQRNKKINKKKRTLGRRHIKNNKKMTGGYEMKELTKITDDQKFRDSYTDGNNVDWVLTFTDEDIFEINKYYSDEGKNIDQIINIFLKKEDLDTFNRYKELKDYVRERIKSVIINYYEK